MRVLFLPDILKGHVFYKRIAIKFRENRTQGAVCEWSARKKRSGAICRGEWRSVIQDDKGRRSLDGFVCRKQYAQAAG